MTTGEEEDHETRALAAWKRGSVEQRQKELDWAYSIGPNDSFADFATASAIIFRKTFGDDFCGLVNGKGKDDQPVALYVEGVNEGNDVKVSIIGPEEAGRLAALAIETGESPDLEGVEMREVNVYSIKDVVSAALEK